VAISVSGRRSPPSCLRDVADFLVRRNLPENLYSMLAFSGLSQKEKEVEREWLIRPSQRGFHNKRKALTSIETERN
jgi:hypothetical protein